MGLTRLTGAERGHLAMLTFATLVAGSFSFGSMIANKIDPVALTAARFAIAASVIGALAALGPGIKRENFRSPWRYVVLGALFASYFTLMFEGLKTAPPVSAAAVFTLTPFMSAFFGWVLMRQVTTPRMALALTVGAFGALWVIFRADMSAVMAFEVGRGEVVYFIGCIAHAAFTPLLKKLNRGEPALVANFGVMAGMVILLLGYGGTGVFEENWAALGLVDWLIILYLAIFTSAVTFLLLRYASQNLPSAKVMAYTYLIPSFVMLSEIALGNGWPPAMTIVGVIMTAVALLLLLKDDAAA